MMENFVIDPLSGQKNREKRIVGRNERKFPFAETVANLSKEEKKRTFQKYSSKSQMSLDSRRFREWDKKYLDNEFIFW